MSHPVVQALSQALGLQGEQGPEPPEQGAIRDLQRLSGGANMETWSFDYIDGPRAQPLILRRRPGGLQSHPQLLPAIPLAIEAELISLARQAGVPVPTVIAQSQTGSALGESLILTRITGEALPRRILRDDRFATARQRLAFECGEALGQLHSIAITDCPGGLRDLDWPADLQRLQRLMDDFGNPSPVHQLALNWLQRQPEPRSRRVLCHGDFRLGNLLVVESGLSAVLDWELAHIGYAGEDLGYLCANVWRFGSDKPVGGFGDTADLLAGYRSVLGDAPSLDELHLWQVYAALGWGLVCLTMLELHRSGADPGLERAAVGRRCSESEIDLLLLLEEADA